ncbi:hypothetical protein SRB5_28490 [Streptomyces sp. RB5]|uniref:Uncharacterized protein n=1 Tax=Streptomyces smaragdinus TaxID=2585196 RepID=A0A7K0CGV2_9ACTN|nr:hypothetical protein [Streptomyces smaragdinus]MQY12710.1 hypothetical protein [Streptomyces smaragdinus]
MTVTNADVDYVALAAAARVLGTETAAETITEALCDVILFHHGYGVPVLGGGDDS